MWACTHAFGTDASIEWNGIGFSFSGGGESAGGEVLILPYDLTREEYLAEEAMR
jgi:hypothetical protein